MANLIGQDLGRYHLVEQLGEGGMASVYKAYDTRLDRFVAIKVISPSQSHSETFLKRFEREAKALANLSHSNIVKVHDYGEEGGLPYLVMEYLPGGTLKSRMGSPMPYQEAARLLLSIAHALGYAHKHNIIHRDIKPANILINDSGQPMLTDFGIAKILETQDTAELTGTGVGIGTPEYMAPEQGRGIEVDQRADVYSLGVVFYELVTGRKPFQADTPMAVLVKHITEPLPRPRQFVPEIPDEVEKVIFKALSKNPLERYQDMDAFSDAFEKLARLGGSKLEDEISTERFERPNIVQTLSKPPAASGVLQTSKISSAQPVHAVKSTGTHTTPPVYSSPMQAGAQLPGGVGRWGGTPYGTITPPKKQKNIIPWLILSGVLLGVLIIIFVGGLGALMYLGVSSGTSTPVPEVEVTSQPEVISKTPGEFDTSIIHLENLSVPLNITYEDNFSDPSSGWEIGSYENGGVGYEGGYFVLAQKDGSTMWGKGNRSFSNVVIDIDAIVTEGPDNNNNDYGIACRLQEKGNGYYFLISGDGYSAILHGKDGAFIPLADWKKTAAVYTGKETNHIQAVCIDQDLALFVNNEKIVELQDPTYSEGDIGLTATTYEANPVRVVFSNLRVAEPVQ